MTVTAAVELFILDQQLKGNTAKTISNYKGFLTRFCAYLPNKDVSGLCLDDVNSYHLMLKQNGVKSISIRTYLRHVKVFLGYLHKVGYLSESLSETVIMPKAPKLFLEVLTDDEAKAVLGSFNRGTVLGRRNYAMFLLMLDCGLRKSEVETLKTENINTEASYMKVKGKGNRERVVPLGSSCRAALQDYAAQRPRQVTFDRLTAKGGEYFFLAEDGSPIGKEAIKNIVRKLKRRTGIKRLKAHLLRHTYATNFLLNRLGDVYELSRLLGHADVETTQIYINIASYYEFMRRQGVRSYMDTVLQ